MNSIEINSFDSINFKFRLRPQKLKRQRGKDVWYKEGNIYAKGSRKRRPVQATCAHNNPLSNNCPIESSNFHEPFASIYGDEVSSAQHFCQDFHGTMTSNRVGYLLLSLSRHYLDHHCLFSLWISQKPYFFIFSQHKKYRNVEELWVVTIYK